MNTPVWTPPSQHPPRSKQLPLKKKDHWSQQTRESRQRPEERIEEEEQEELVIKQSNAIHLQQKKWINGGQF